MWTVFSCTVNANIKIGVVGKTKNDSFYQKSHRGCEAFAETQKELECVYDGADDYQDVRTQVLIVNDLIQKGVDGLLISTTDSFYLVEGALKAAFKKGIPVVTFDSDLLAQHRQYRLAYVGTNNFDFGKALGEVAKKYKREVIQSICIQSGHQTTPNLNERIEGVRFALSGSSERLTGTSGWVEHPRCPLFTMGRRDDALKQLVSMIKLPNSPIFLAVAGFAQFNPDYMETIEPFKKQIQNKQISIISADTEQLQLEALKASLSSENVGQRPFEMGMKGAELLYHFIVKGQRPFKDQYYLDYHYCLPKKLEHCTDRTMQEMQK